MAIENCALLTIENCTHLGEVAWRGLAGMDGRGVDKVRAANRELVVGRLRALRPARATVDFDGSVLGTRRRAERAAVDYNPAREGQRSCCRCSPPWRRPARRWTCRTAPATWPTRREPGSSLTKRWRACAARCPERGWRRAPTAPSSATTSSTCSSGAASTTPCPCPSSASRRSRLPPCSPTISPANSRWPPAHRGANAKRSPLWNFEQPRTMRNDFLLRAGRFLHPQRKPVLSIMCDPRTEATMNDYLAAFAL